MNHPLHFRVWSKQASKWMSNIVINDAGTPILLYSEKKGKKVEHHVYLIDNYEPVVQWATGLKDKSGNDIYEGDVLQYVNGLDGESVSDHTVTWQTDGWYLPKTNGWTIVGNIFEGRESDRAVSKPAAPIPVITSIESVQSSDKETT